MARAKSGTAQDAQFIQVRSREPWCPTTNWGRGAQGSARRRTPSATLGMRHGAACSPARARTRPLRVLDAPHACACPLGCSHPKGLLSGERSSSRPYGPLTVAWWSSSRCKWRDRFRWRPTTGRWWRGRRRGCGPPRRAAGRQRPSRASLRSMARMRSRSSALPPMRPSMTPLSCGGEARGCGGRLGRWPVAWATRSGSACAWAWIRTWV